MLFTPIRQQELLGKDKSDKGNAANEYQNNLESDKNKSQRLRSLNVNKKPGEISKQTHTLSKFLINSSNQPKSKQVLVRFL